MAAQLAAAEPFPVLVARYVCGCGATETRHGRHAADLPPGWVYLPLDENATVDPPVACVGCALAARTPPMGPV